jgi:hypothetical protein
MAPLKSYYITPDLPILPIKALTLQSSTATAHAKFHRLCGPNCGICRTAAVAI